MKRTNLVLDEELLQTATRLLGAKTYSAAVNHALAETIRVAKVRGLADLVGTGIWDGDLSRMRDDQASTKKRPSRKT
jgi:Arc/MetJ family transcription regulator